MTLLVDAMNAYLLPLLKKHAAGKVLVWEDLEASHAAAATILKQSKPQNPFVSSRLDALHQSQVNAYREAATKAVQEWALAFPLEPMEEGDSEQAFVDRCVSALIFVPSPAGTTPPGTNPANYTWPNWKLDNAKALASNEVRKRAKVIYDKYHPTTEDENGDEQQAEGEDAEEGEPGDGDDAETGDEINDDDEEHEDGDDEDGEVGVGAMETNNAATSTTPSKTKQQHGKNNNANRNKRKGVGNTNKSATVRKKPTASKGYRNRGGRRGGRGGGGNVRSGN